MRANHRAQLVLRGLSALHYLICLSSAGGASIQTWEMDTAVCAQQATHVDHQYSLRLHVLQVPIQERHQLFAQSALLAPPAQIQHYLLHPVRMAPTHQQMAHHALLVRSRSSARVSRPSRATLAREASTQWAIKPHAPLAQLATIALLIANRQSPAKLAISVSVQQLYARHAQLGIIAQILVRSLFCALKGSIPWLAPWSAVNVLRGKVALS
jgi:hypothetical protein